MVAANTALVKLNINTMFHGVYLDGGAASTSGPTICEPNYPANDCIWGSVINVSTGYDAVVLDGQNNHLWGNTIRGQVAGTTVSMGGDKARVVLNRIEACSQVSILLHAYGTYALVWGNTVVGCDVGGSTGILVGLGGSGNSARVRKNTVTNTEVGIGVDGTSGIVAQNDSSGNLGDGIRVITNGNFIKDNTANSNGEYGFNVMPGNTNAGGNHASGNAVANCTGDDTFCAGVTP
jgi:hypothetical protein